MSRSIYLNIAYSFLIYFYNPLSFQQLFIIDVGMLSVLKVTDNTFEGCSRKLRMVATLSWMAQYSIENPGNGFTHSQIREDGLGWVGTNNPVMKNLKDIVVNSSKPACRLFSFLFLTLFRGSLWWPWLVIRCLVDISTASAISTKNTTSFARGEDSEYRHKTKPFGSYTDTQIRLRHPDI